MTISAENVKKLRQKTGAGFMDCKKALTETEGNFDQAVDLLRKKGVIAAAKRQGRATKEGSVSSYIHPGGRIGVMVELNCETDFVARTDDFKNLQKDLAMHIAASAPVYMAPEDVPSDVLEREKDVYREQAKQSGKPDNIIEKIIEGRMKKYFAEICLLHQPFVKEEERTIQQIVEEMAGKLGENIQISRFCRYELGETASD